MSRDRGRNRGGSNGGKPADKPKGDKPFYVLRRGVLKLSCWKNEGDHGTWFSCKLVRLYKDGETWKDTPSLNDSDLAQAASMLLHADHELGMERGGSEEFADEQSGSGGSPYHDGNGEIPQ